MAGDVVLDELERDALTELVNIGVSRAASGLRKMVDRQVLLSVPCVEILGRHAAAALIAHRETEKLTAVQQDFVGAFSGRALLIFPESNGRHLTQAVLGEGFGDLDIEELQDEALAETGNIILNACLSSIANMLRHPLRVSLPSIRRGASKVIFDVMEKPGDQSYVMFLYINFSVRDRQIKGYLALIMELPALVALRVLVADYIERVVSEAI